MEPGPSISSGYSGLRQSCHIGAFRHVHLTLPKSAKMLTSGNCILTSGNCVHSQSINHGAQWCSCLARRRRWWCASNVDGQSSVRHLWHVYDMVSTYLLILLMMMMIEKKLLYSHHWTGLSQLFLIYYYRAGFSINVIFGLEKDPVAVNCHMNGVVKVLPSFF